MNAVAQLWPHISLVRASLLNAQNKSFFGEGAESEMSRSVYAT